MKDFIHLLITKYILKLGFFFGGGGAILTPYKHESQKAITSATKTHTSSIKITLRFQSTLQYKFAYVGLRMAWLSAHEQICAVYG
jgi:hypothetical protein